MDQNPEGNAARLRERAAYCRKLADDAVSHGIARELESIAREYEQGADRLELRLA